MGGEEKRLENPAMSFKEVSIDRSMSFVKALQELKNLRPQLYSAAEYCEKSYAQSGQKQMVLHNLKDYAVRALVNAVDHLGTMAYKVTDILEKQTLDVMTMEVKVSQFNQELLTCQTFMGKEGLRQQRLLAFVPRHHKHYILPNAYNRDAHFSTQAQSDDAKQDQDGSCFQASDTPTTKASWHLASETKSTLKGTSYDAPSLSCSVGDSKTSAKPRVSFHLSDNEESRRNKSSTASAQLLVGGSKLSATRQKYVVAKKDLLEGYKPLTAFRSFDNPRREIVRALIRSKTVLSAFYVKQRI